MKDEEFDNQVKELTMKGIEILPIAHDSVTSYSVQDTFEFCGVKWELWDEDKEEAFEKVIDKANELLKKREPQ
ncbi:hypothetical protein [Xanthocytophaga agilis]|uniref:Uncharacterized protein n=1 Tax=Xanthocytophaga agilis TaxID=3048010 RepID=A0AAE3R2L1_9BACT|nr:hypothetical protein [Xanthocytophaga agilis]MDJ1500479.1 hypothetical protein [Xanthocytophaga agilis]